VIPSKHFFFGVTLYACMAGVAELHCCIAGIDDGFVSHFLFHKA